ncbi:hypothetical protein [Virgibacillus salexigens]|nr:hypothetical protein [Virgibacillus massiliensis]MYL41815.1 hypothetical protein [Virgibacillus massiliensis]
MEDEKIEFFKKLRDISDEIIQAYEKDDEKELESASGRFLYLMMTADGLK